ncbi:MAG: glycosyltransferase family 4 protein [Candidatus Eisenbacteria bacterium]
MISSACMVVHSYCPDDPRVRREAEALAAAGARVDVICLRNEGEAREETVGGVRYLRLPIRRKRGGAARYLFEYGSFLLLAFILATALAMRRRYDVFQAHNMPDLLVLCGLFHRLRGARVVLDLHDLVPEVYIAKYGLSDESKLIRALTRVESFSIARADAAITTSEAFRRTLIERGIEGSKIHLVLNSPDEKIFPERRPPRFREDDSFRLIYHGTLVHRSGLDVALRALALLKDEIPGALLDAIGDGDGAEEFARLARELGIDDRVRFLGHRPLAEIPSHIEAADLGLVPNRRNVFTERNLPTRIFEYLRMGRPVIASRLPGVLDYYSDEELLYFEPDDERDLARAIREVHDHPEKTRSVMEKGIRVYERHRWEGESRRYLELLQSLGR